jgi:hypothetical protein
MAKKDFLVTMDFPAVKAGKHVQCAQVSATNLGRAADAGVREAMTREGVKGKRHDEVKITVKLLKPTKGD